VPGVAARPVSVSAVRPRARPQPRQLRRRGGLALTQEPCGITLQILARKEERQQRTSDKSGTAAYIQERSDWQSPHRGCGGERNEWHGRSAAAPVPSFLSPLGGDEVRQGAAAVRARCRADGGSEHRLVAQQCAGAVQRRRGISRCTDRSAGGCADRRTVATARARATAANRTRTTRRLPAAHE
jgi:hypothetical protein